MSGMAAVMSRMNELQAMVNPVPAEPKVEASKVEETAAGDDFAAVLQQALNPGLPGAADLTTATLANLTKPATAPPKAPVAPVAEVAAPPTKTAPVSSGSGASGDDIVAKAKTHLGVPYVWGGTTTRGFDCSGLVQHVMRDLGVEMPRVARDQAKKGEVIPSLAQAKPGDLLGMRNGTHIAIYLGDNKILHAPRPGESVSIRSLMRSDDIDTIRRVLPAENAPAAAQSIAGARAALEARSGS
jgi:cell wall-associated NlpC family hydrolase